MSLPRITWRSTGSRPSYWYGANCSGCGKQNHRRLRRGREIEHGTAVIGEVYLVLAVGAGRFSPGTLMLQHAHGAANTLFYVGLTYRWVSIAPKRSTP